MNHLPDDIQTMNASELGKLIGRATSSIVKDATNRPETLPPRFIVPGSKAMLWRVVDVRAWMEEIVAITQADREAQRRLAAKTGMGLSTSTRQLGHLGRKPLGRQARAALDKKEEASG